MLGIASTLATSPTEATGLASARHFLCLALLDLILYCDTSNHTNHPNTMAFQFDQPYESQNLMSQEIRDDFAQLVEDSCDSDRILRSLAGHLPASDLAEFMDDFAMGRV